MLESRKRLVQPLVFIWMGAASSECRPSIGHDAIEASRDVRQDAAHKE